MTDTALALPRDAQLVELRADRLTFRTRELLLPGTMVSCRLLLEGQPLRLEAPVRECLVVTKEKSGLVLDCRLGLDALPGADLQLIALFIAKGRGSPGLSGPADTK